MKTPDLLRHPRFAAVPASLARADPAQLLDWASAELSARGMVRAGPPSWLRVRHWSIVACLPTNHGPMWAKANAAGFAHEAALLELIGTGAPGAVLAPLAVQVERGWLLTRDGGRTLREQAKVADGTPVQACWSRLVTRYAAVQRRLIPLADDAVAVGTPDVRGMLCVESLESVTAAAAAELHGAHRLTGQEVERLLALRPTLLSLAHELADSGVPSSVEHNDPHLGNVFATSGALFDFADAVVGHPFLGLAGALAAAAAELDHRVIAELRAHYLKAFAEFDSPENLQRSSAIAELLVHLPRAAVWLRMVPEGRAAFPAALPRRLRALLAAASTLPGGTR